MPGLAYVKPARSAPINVWVGNAEAKWSDSAAQIMRVQNLGNENWIGARDLPDAVTRIVAFVQAKKGKLGTVFFIGHGGAAGQDIGSKFVSTNSMTELPKNGRITTKMGRGPNRKSIIGVANPDYHALKRLHSCFAPGSGRIVLGGCNVANGNVPMRMSQVLPGIAVHAYDEPQQPGMPGPEGHEAVWMDGRLVSNRPAFGLLNFLRGLI